MERVCFWLAKPLGKKNLRELQKIDKSATYRDVAGDRQVVCDHNKFQAVLDFLKRLDVYDGSFWRMPSTS